MTSFWRPLPRGGGVWWARCDNCYWSGPIQRFHVWADVWNGGEATICLHYWCNTPELKAEFERLGFRRMNAGYRGGQ